MPPGFIGVGAGKWTVPGEVAVPAHPEIYAFPRSGGILVGHSDKTVTQIALPPNVAEGGVGFIYSPVSSQNLWSIQNTPVPDTDPVEYQMTLLKSDDGGLTWGLPTDQPHLGNRVPQSVLGEHDLYAYQQDDEGAAGQIYRNLNEAGWQPWGPPSTFQAYRATTARVFGVLPQVDGSDLSTGSIESMTGDGGLSTVFPMTSGPISDNGDDSRVLVYQQTDPDHRSIFLAGDTSLVATDLEEMITNQEIFFPFPINFQHARCNDTGTWILTACRPLPYDGEHLSDFQGEIWRSTNGTSWTRTHIGIPALGGEGLAFVGFVGYCTTPPGVWWVSGFAANLGTEDTPDFQYVWLRSGDDGASWETVTLPSQDPTVIEKDAQFVSGGQPWSRSS